MKVQVSIKQVDSEYNKKYADEYNGGEESDGNWKYNWSVTSIVPNVTEFKVIDKQDFVLSGKFNDGIKKEYTLPNMQVIQCITESSEIIEFAVSNELIIKTHKAKINKYDVVRFYFYLNDKNELFNIADLAFIIGKDYPKELLELKIDEPFTGKITLKDQ